MKIKRNKNMSVFYLMISSVQVDGFGWGIEELSVYFFRRNSAARPTPDMPNCLACAAERHT